MERGLWVGAAVEGSAGNVQGKGRSALAVFHMLNSLGSPTVSIRHGQRIIGRHVVAMLILRRCSQARSRWEALPFDS